MKGKAFALFLMVASLLVISAPLLAHHGEANYDTTKVVTIKGTIADFQFINPHVQVFIDVKNDKGVTEKWLCEATSPNRLVREGWTRTTLKPGDTVTAMGHQAKNGSPTLRLMKIVLADGTELDHL